MGFIKYALTLGTGLFIGYIAGVDKQENPRYELFTVEKIDYLKSKELDKHYRLKQVGNDFFLGDLYHQMKGVRVLARSETRELIERKMSGAKIDSIDSIDNCVRDKDFLDKVEDTGKGIKKEVEKFIDKNFK
ncbi:MAG: hypothetical protein KJ583_03225 [Nanoarchaeota archaeon]|nr:hypothetical protein [Nanoarchaeota archaeon]MBU1269389.1 hypothetical protein [Nanoarchaeota archaeon]MBU1604306.1 hypothetical protein [Nanoarchaeota archaeon]MBU2442897.1 hypothetical protein [Nanoarchaeota archaeon]